MSSIQDQLLTRIRRRGRGKVFTPKDFLDLGNRDAVDQALSRLVKSDSLRRLGRGLYHYPRVNKRLKISIAPDIDEIAYALARQTGSQIIPSGATAANRLGLSTQVPGKYVYLTDGESRQVKVGQIQIAIKHVTPKGLPQGRPTSATVLQALRYLGKENVDDAVLSKVAGALSLDQRLQLLQDSQYTTGWMLEAVRKIASEDPEREANG